MKTLSPTLKKLVTQLNDGKFHSGNVLGETLKISRNAVWKHINQLTKLGIDIISVHSKGYCLQQPLQLLDTKKIQAHLRSNTSLHIGKLEILGSIPSTNDYLRSQPVTVPLHICLAEHQSAGKGRLGHQWHSPFGANIYLSCRWLITEDVSHLSGLSLAVSLAVIAALQEYGVPDLEVKWPNDILWHGQKLGGVLIEMDVESHGVSYITIGIGLNVNMPTSATESINQPWTSLDRILGQPQDRNRLTGMLITHLLDYLAVFATKGFSHFITEWQRNDALANKNINLNCGNKVISGQMMGVNASGHLLLKQADGNVATYSAGEASVKK